jgi:hypothetical protein
MNEKLGSGKELSEKYDYVLNYGKKVIEAQADQTTDWEHKDYIYIFPEDIHPSKIGKDEYYDTEVELRSSIWAKYKNEISNEFQKWLDSGWQPIGSFDEYNIIFYQFQTGIFYNNSFLGWLFDIFNIYKTFGLQLLNTDTYAQPIYYRLPMRRPATNETTNNKKETVEINMRLISHKKIFLHFNAFVDDKKIGELTIGESKNFMIEPGNHQIYLKSGLKKTNTIKHDFGKDTFLFLVFQKKWTGGIEIREI